jgi:hypothetical protein
VEPGRGRGAALKALPETGMGFQLVEGSLWGRVATLLVFNTERAYPIRRHCVRSCITCIVTLRCPTTRTGAAPSRTNRCRNWCNRHTRCWVPTGVKRLDSGRQLDTAFLAELTPVAPAG